MQYVCCNSPSFVRSSVGWDALVRKRVTQAEWDLLGRDPTVQHQLGFFKTHYLLIKVLLSEAAYGNSNQTPHGIELLCFAWRYTLGILPVMTMQESMARFLLAHMITT